jgi:siderophore synthetase component
MKKNEELSAILERRILEKIINETLQEKLYRARTMKKEVIITTTTYEFKEFLLNWLCSIRRFSLDKHLIIYAVDEKLAIELIWKYSISNVYLDDRQWRLNHPVQ